MRGLTKTVKIGEREIIVTEPSMIEIRNWLESKVEPVADALWLAAFRDLDEAYIAALPLLTGYSALELEKDFEARFSEIRQVIEAAREVNPDFFLTLDRLIEFGQKRTAQPS